MHDLPEEITGFHCPSCGAELPADEEEGLCPACGAPFGQQTMTLPAVRREDAEQAWREREEASGAGFDEEG